MRARTSGVLAVVGRDRSDAALARRVAATESNQIVLAGAVRVGDHERNVDAVREQHAKAAHADVVVGEDDGARHGGIRASAQRSAGSFAGRSSTARIM